MSEDLPKVSVSPARKLFFSGASIVWIIPILALFVALGVAWQSYQDRGPLITVEFESGAGIEAGETELKFRDVTVGVVEKVGFSERLDRVTANIRLDKEIAPYVDGGSVFWIVQPEVTLQGITGLSTVLSGVYIEGSWDDQIGSYADRFFGASEAPLIRPGQSGLQLAFRTIGTGQITDNAPILYKGIEVGRVGRATIAPRGNYAIVEALIFEQHRALVNDSTRFWDASGFEVSIGPAGAEIDFSSLATLLGGGVTFDTFVSGGDTVQDGAIFDIFPDKETARNSVFNASEVEPLKMGVIFDDNIAGLVVGAAVELGGLNIGEVEALSGLVDEARFGDSRVRLNANLSIQPSRLGLPGKVSKENALAFLKDRVAAGMRARLASASLLTGGLKVELVMVDDASPAVVVSENEVLPLLPTTQSAVTDAAASVEGVFNRINSLPIGELLNSAIMFLNSARSFVTDEDLRETPQDVRALLAELQGLVSSTDVQNIPVSLNATLTRVEGLVAQLEEQQLVSRLGVALDNAAVAAADVSSSIEGVPQLITQIQDVAAKAQSLEVNELIEELAKLTRSADALISTDDAVALPGSLKRALDEVNYTLQRCAAVVPLTTSTVHWHLRAMQPTASPFQPRTCPKS